jgi:hypothetical protein
MQSEPAEDPRKREVFALMERYCQLGRLLPQGDDIAAELAIEDRATRASARMIIAEMNKIKVRIDALLAAATRSQQRGT